MQCTESRGAADLPGPACWLLMPRPPLPPCVQAGARVVYAVEASDMAHHARALAAANPALGARIKVLHGKVETIEVPEKVRERR